MSKIKTGFKDVYFTYWLIIGSICHEKLKVTVWLLSFQQATPLPAVLMASKDVRLIHDTEY